MGVFTVDSSCLTVQGLGHVLSGAKDTSVVAMTLNGASGIIYFPTPSTWRADVMLLPGTNTFNIRAQSPSTGWTAATKVELELPKFTGEEHWYYGALDKHGLMVGLDRNPGEKNWDYRTRLISFAASRTGAHMEGLFWALAHELGLQPEPQALSLEPRRDGYGEMVGINIYFQVGSTAVYIESDNLIVDRESHLVDPRFRRITLDYEPVHGDAVDIVTSRGVKVSKERYQVSTIDRWVTFLDHDLDYECVFASYAYRRSIEHSTMTMGELKAELEAIRVGDEQLLTVAVADDTTPASWLMIGGREAILWGRVHYTPSVNLRVKPLDDQRWQKSLLNRFGAAYGTKLERFARITREKSSVGWDNLVLDEGFWDVDPDDRSLDFLPRLFDAVFGRWYCTHPSHDATYSLWDYLRYGGKCPIHTHLSLVYKGVPSTAVQSGPGTADSLLAFAEEYPEEL
jgi:hypothetical protein